MTAINNVAIVGFSLSILGYVARLFEGLPSLWILTGMLIITMGYCSLLYGAIKDKAAALKEAHKDDAGKHSGSNHGNVYTKIGYWLLFTFFTLIHFIPQLTFTVRYYDKVAALGSVIKIVPGIPVVAGASVMLLYYVLSAYQKLFEDEWIDKLQLVSRSVLVAYYGMMIAQAAH